MVFTKVEILETTLKEVARRLGQRTEASFVKVIYIFDQVKVQQHNNNPKIIFVVIHSFQV